MASDSHHLSILRGVGRGHSGLIKGDPELRERSQLGAAMATCKSGASDSHPSCSQMEGAERAIVHACAHTGTLSQTHTHSQVLAHVHRTITDTGTRAHSWAHRHTLMDTYPQHVKYDSHIIHISKETGVSLGAAGWTYWSLPQCLFHLHDLIKTYLAFKSWCKIPTSVQAPGAHRQTWLSGPGSVGGHGTISI